MSKEQELQAVSQASGPSESELALQETISRLQEERDALSLQYQAQVTYTDHVTHASSRIYTGEPSVLKTAQLTHVKILDHAVCAVLLQFI